MKADRSHMAYAFELDGQISRLEGDALVPEQTLEKIEGDRWIVTDFNEGMSRFMSVDGPVKFAEIMVRRKLQEAGEFDEPVEIFTHWKKRRGKNGTDIFFTAVPTRLARTYLDQLSTGPDHTLIFAMYGVLWQVLQQMGGIAPVAVVFRHNRFAEVLVGTRKKIYFANRCVAFDTQPEQLEALWENVRSDIESVQTELRLEVEKIVCLSWIDACEPPPWPETWQARTVFLDAPQVMIDHEAQPITWPAAAMAQPAYRSVSPPARIACYYARRWSPVANLLMLAAAALLIAGMVTFRVKGSKIDSELAQVHHQIEQIDLQSASLPLTKDEFTSRLKFIQNLDQYRSQPSYREVVNDLTLPEFHSMRIQSLKLDYLTDVVRVELFGDIVAPFDQAHGHYKEFLAHLRKRGYHIDESRFETQISKSQMVLKLIRPIA